MNNFSDRTHLIEAAKERLSSCGLRLSHQRVEIVAYLMTHATHPTVDTIYSDLSKFMPTLSRTTVYNTLASLSSYGAVLALDIEPKNRCYDGDINPHAHFLCEKCGCIIDLPLDFDPMKSASFEGLQVNSAQLYYKGLCRKCAKNAAARKKNIKNN